MAARQHGERAIVHAAVVQIRADRQRRIVGVRPEANVVVPLHFFATLRPFVVQLRVMELDVRSDQIGNDVAEWRLR